MSDVLYSSGGYRDEDVTEAVDFELYRARDLRSWERPKAILLAGQPGAGKSVLSKVV